MHVLIITPHYPPDGGPSAPLFRMLAEELVQRGHALSVVAATPHYPGGRPPDGWVRPPGGRETREGVDIHWVAVPAVDRSRLTRRLQQFAAYQLGAAWRVRGLRPDVAIASGPGLQTVLPFLLARRRAARTVFSVHDVYPDIGVTLGIFRHRAVIALVTALERACLRAADKVRYLAPAFRAPLLRMGVTEARLSFIPDWVDTQFVRPLPRDNAFAREHGLTGRFVVLYGGNLGFSQGLESVIDAAALLRERDDIRFAFVGQGAGRSALLARAHEAELANVSFIDYQPRERLPELLASGDAGLVSMRRSTVDSLPSKVYSHLASGRPLLAAVPPTGDVAGLLRRANAAQLVAPEDPRAIADGVLSLAALAPAELAAMGERGRAFAVEHHSPQAAATSFEALLQSAPA